MCGVSDRARTCEPQNHSPGSWPRRILDAADSKETQNSLTEMNAAEETAQNSLTEINAAEKAAAERTSKRARLGEMTWKRAGTRTGECEQV